MIYITGQKINLSKLVNFVAFYTLFNTIISKFSRILTKDNELLLL